MSVTVHGTNGVTFNDGSLQASAPIGKNKIINGDMRIDQRNAGSAVTTSSDYTLDRWKFQEGGAGGQVTSVQQVTDAPAGFVHSVKLTNTTASSSVTADAYNMLWQAVEGLNWSDLGWGASGALTATLSFWVKASIAGNYSVAIRSNNNDRSYVSAYAISSADTWEQKTITIAAPTAGTFSTTNTKAIQVAFTNSMGSNWTSSGNDAWQSESKLGATGTQVALTDTLNSTWQVTGVQLEVGSSATDFEHRPYDMELARCQRYCWKHGGEAAGQFLNAQGAYWDANYIAFGLVSPPVPMRAAPSLTEYGTVIVHRLNTNYTGWTWGFITGVQSQSWFVSGNKSSHGVTAQHSIVKCSTTSDFFIYSAEL